MKKSIGWILLIIVLLSLSSIACGFLGGDDEPTVVPEGSPGEDPEGASGVEGEDILGTPSASDGTSSVDSEPDVDVPSPEATDVPGLDGTAVAEPGSAIEDSAELDMSALSQEFDFDSYRLMFLTTFVGTDKEGKAVEQRIEGDVAYVAEPASLQMSVFAEGIPGAEESIDMSMAQLGDTTYTVVPGFGCVAAPTAEGSLFADNPLSEFVNPDVVLDDISGARRVGEESVNGIPTIAYEFDKSFLDDEPDIDWVLGTINVAKDGNYVVRLVMDGEGSFKMLKLEEGSSGELHVEFELSEVNQSLEVEIPFSCETDLGSGLDLPMLEDATELTSFAGFQGYQSQETVEDAVSFYDESLSSLDWVKDEASSIVSAGSAIVYYEKDGELITLFVGENVDGGGISVTISIAGGE